MSSDRTSPRAAAPPLSMHEELGVDRGVGDVAACRTLATFKERGSAAARGDVRARVVGRASWNGAAMETEGQSMLTAQSPLQSLSAGFRSRCATCPV